MLTNNRRFAYLCLCLAGGAVVQLGASLGYIDHLNAERTRADQRAAAQRAEQVEQTRQLVCRLAAGYLRSFRDSPPPAERTEIRDTWAALSLQFNCPPLE